MNNLFHLNNILINSFYYIGEYGYILSFLLSLFVLKNKLLFFFLSLVTLCLNVVLKQILQQERPKRIETIKPNIYGMPSGHGQLTAFISFYTLLQSNNIWIYLIQTSLLLITIIQRVLFQKHTLFQVVIGVIIGYITGLIGLYI